MNPQVETASLDSLIIRLFERIDEHNMPWLLAAAQRLRDSFGALLVDLVPSYTTLMLHYDVRALDEWQARELIEQALTDLQPLEHLGGQRHELPVWYHPSVGPDLEPLARHSGLSPNELILRHCSRDYSVFALGFAPGFAYLGLVEPQLMAPRLATPRRRVAAGSVGIAERQTAIYPLESPGGWNLLGRTPVALFDPKYQGYSLLQPGDRVRFVAISHGEFLRLGGDDSPLEECP
ncbi:5-oxoprolinase subunit PxpB [Halopseudomonas phragmitis]|uniref:Allophanate hydrolase n=1 Tax=Halopseudomonas phragmitis TaxID=1931241 RepID=A0A1V0B217_9GAMM|nr:5-oxoprolinase subunit PxpB [Halopseudomonas phragmitis]AQZ93969.1 allophanate hydrolase [Halopseudomonas phragmitis]